MPPAAVRAACLLATVFCTAIGGEPLPSPPPGDAQLAHMLNDRPAMAETLDGFDFLGNWARDRFASDRDGVRIRWDPAPPQSSGNGADHVYTIQNGTDTCVLRIASLYPNGPHRGQPMTGADLWFRFVFETFDSQGDFDQETVRQLALSGKLDRAAFVRESARIEYEALRKTRDFYAGSLIPEAAKAGRPLELPEMLSQLPAAFDAWVSTWPEPARSPWNNFGAYYDHALDPRRVSGKPLALPPPGPSWPQP